MAQMPEVVVQVECVASLPAGDAIIGAPEWLELPCVYVAGPYSKGDVAENVRKAVQAANEVLNLGAVPYLPHTTHLWHLISPKPHEFWLWYDMRWLRTCDVVYRLPGESVGADAEEDFAGRMRIPVVYGLDELRTLLRKWRYGG